MTRITVSAVLIFSWAISIHAQSEFTPQALLKPKFTGLYSIPPNLDARAGYDMLGARAGINIVFTPGFKPEAAVPLRIDTPNKPRIFGSPGTTRPSSSRPIPKPLGATWNL